MALWPPLRQQLLSSRQVLSLTGTCPSASELTATWGCPALRSDRRVGHILSMARRSAANCQLSSSSRFWLSAGEEQSSRMAMNNHDYHIINEDLRSSNNHQEFFQSYLTSSAP